MALVHLAVNCHMNNCTGHIDNTPFYFIFGGIGLVIVITAVVGIVQASRKQGLLDRGVVATGEITKIAPRTVLKSGSVVMDMTLAVTAPDGEVFEAETSEKFPINDLPRVGWTVPVRYAEKNHNRVVVSGAASSAEPGTSDSHP